MNHDKSQQILMPKKKRRKNLDEKSHESMNYAEHIYENVTNRYKYKIFNGILNSFTSKARDLKLLRKRDKHILNYSSMNVRNSPHHDDYDDSGNNNNNTTKTYDAYDDKNHKQFQRNNECEDENSYTSCEEDNIYENLDFFNDANYFYNDSLDDWMQSLSHDIADYEMDNIMFVKSIPSVFNIRQPRCRRRQLNKSEITVNFLKILWNGENNVDMMSLLLQTFSNLLRDQCTTQTQESMRETATSATQNNGVEQVVSLKKLGKKQNLKKIDKKIYQKFVKRVILSLSLNSLMITYSKSQKLVSALVCSELFFKLPSSVRVTQLIAAIKIHFKFAREEIVLTRRLLKYKFDEIKVQKAIASASESIYQQIWTCQTIAHDDSAKAIINNENIYATIECVRESDDNQWEIDEEFSFMNAKIGATSMTNQYNNDDDHYKTVWVLYSDENPANNKFFYDSSYTNYLNSTKDNRRDESASEVECERELKSIEINRDIPEKYYESVDAWKVILRSPHYMEDEEDIVSGLKLNKNEKKVFYSLSLSVDRK